jgi:hypothetical protein
MQRQQQPSPSSALATFAPVAVAPGIGRPSLLARIHEYLRLPRLENGRRLPRRAPLVRAPFALLPSVGDEAPRTPLELAFAHPSSLERSPHVLWVDASTPHTSDSRQIGTWATIVQSEQSRSGLFASGQMRVIFRDDGKRWPLLTAAPVSAPRTRTNDLRDVILRATEADPNASHIREAVIETRDPIELCYFVAQCIHRDRSGLSAVLAIDDGDALVEHVIGLVLHILGSARRPS